MKSKAPATQPEIVIRELMTEVRAILGWVEEVSTAIVREHHDIKQLLQINPNTPNLGTTYERKRPSDGKSFGYHSAPLREIADRSIYDGENSVRLRNSAVIYIYTLWDDNYRGKLETLGGFEKNHIKSPLFGDLRRYRNAIAHANGNLEYPTEVLALVKVGERVALKTDQFVEVFEEIVRELPRIASKYFGLTLDFHMGTQIL